jgi:hypothetical protein
MVTMFEKKLGFVKWHQRERYTLADKMPAVHRKAFI